MKKVFLSLAVTALALAAYENKGGNPNEGEKTVASVTLNHATASLAVGDTLRLTATVAPDSATNKAVTWASSNTTVATVSSGLVTAKAEGSANITVTTQDGSKTATCAVTAVEAAG